MARYSRGEFNRGEVARAEIVGWRIREVAENAKRFEHGSAGRKDRGIAKGHEKFFISTMHTDDDIDYTINALREVVELLA